ncbi:hypothetical protein ARMSODRAFT_1061261 [Armillaria solidipes]|uniref:Uncharacterized protein n=1 Tax=Armillaria solidipes TaxID=1076256 RepID=A0A2H3B673_9AGAR|nr:hypothetical protein ARMSODRAFT_1061261 [Armillaria solidipes]
MWLTPDEYSYELCPDDGLPSLLDLIHRSQCSLTSLELNNVIFTDLLIDVLHLTPRVQILKISFRSNQAAQAFLPLVRNLDIAIEDLFMEEPCSFVDHTFFDMVHSRWNSGVLKVIKLNVSEPGADVTWDLTLEHITEFRGLKDDGLDIEVAVSRRGSGPGGRPTQESYARLHSPEYDGKLPYIVSPGTTGRQILPNWADTTSQKGLLRVTNYWELHFTGSRYALRELTVEIEQYYQPIFHPSLVRFCLGYWRTVVPARSPKKERARFDAQNGIPRTIFFLSNICQIFFHVAQVPAGSAISSVTYGADGWTKGRDFSTSVKLPTD